LYLLKTQKFSLRKVYIFHYFSLFMSDRPVPYIAIFAGAMLIGSEIESHQNPPVAKAFYADINNDGMPDIILRDLGGKYKIFLGRRDGSYLEQRDISHAKENRLETEVRELFDNK